MVAVVVEENMMAIVTREAVVPVVIVEGSIVAKQGYFLSWPSKEYPFLWNSKKGISVYVRREIQSMLLWVKYDYVSRGSGKLGPREGLSSPS